MEDSHLDWNVFLTKLEAKADGLKDQMRQFRHFLLETEFKSNVSHFLPAPLPEPYQSACLDLHSTVLTSPSCPTASENALLFKRVSFSSLQSRTYSGTPLLSGDLGWSSGHLWKGLLSDVLSTCHSIPYSFTSPPFNNRLEGFGCEMLSLFNYLLILGSKKRGLVHGKQLSKKKMLRKPNGYEN